MADVLAFTAAWAEATFWLSVAMETPIQIMKWCRANSVWFMQVQTTVALPLHNRQQKNLESLSICKCSPTNYSDNYVNCLSPGRTAVATWNTNLLSSPRMAAFIFLPLSLCQYACYFLSDRTMIAAHAKVVQLEDNLNLLDCVLQDVLDFPSLKSSSYATATEVTLCESTMTGKGTCKVYLALIAATPGTSSIQFVGC
ncbi:uncharacterized protein LOC125457627 isoform X2 [Stegostoma tigrinum]|uniref:uncharacterized protein LOC125457627 isoform X2 n=1 Tax=Stegostoma tigrinum TaxID=3053191 RepID=UPI00202B2F1F|nr:uncharacterized protein LOC125457627 isoform X2 [Stegostoma tigrinum]